MNRHCILVFQILILLFPMLLNSQPLIIAHRGASHDAPENTLPAFQLAWEQDADGIEIDVHLTRDGEIVCIHDKDTKAMTGAKYVIERSTMEELNKLDVGSWFDPKWEGTKIPTLSAVLATVPDGKLAYIEVKCGPEILPKLMEVIKDSGLSKEQVVVISFNHDVIQILKQNAPNVTAYCLISYKRTKIRLQSATKEALKLLKNTKADGISTSTQSPFSKEHLKAIQEAGYSYHVWTIDNPKKAIEFAEWGVDSITTNRPAVIREHLENSTSHLHAVAF